MSVYDRWQLLSFPTGLIILWISWVKLPRMTKSHRPQAEVDRWQLRCSGLGVVYFGGWLIADFSFAHRSAWSVLIDGFFLGMVIVDLIDWWRRNKQRKLAEWAGYKAEAIRARLRLAFGGAG